MFFFIEYTLILTRFLPQGTLNVLKQDVKTWFRHVKGKQKLDYYPMIVFSFLNIFSIENMTTSLLV